MSYTVQRSILVNAPAEKVFDTIADFNSWTAWSPWLCSDKDAKVTVSANPNSVGSLYHWVGEVVGEGEIERTRMERDRFLEDELRFIKPFKSTARIRFELSPQGSTTKVTWVMHGKLPWFLFWMKASIQTFIGMDFERGLRMLAEYIETGAVKSNVLIQPSMEDGPHHVIGVRATCAVDRIGESMDASYNQAQAKMAQAGIPIDGSMISVYHRFDVKKQEFEYTSGYVVPESTRVGSTGLASFTLPRSKAFVVRHTGSYNHLGNAWSAAHANLRSQKLKLAKKLAGYEFYRNSPETTDERDLVTEIYIPIQ